MPNPFSLCVFPAFCLRAALCRLRHEPAGGNHRTLCPRAEGQLGKCFTFLNGLFISLWNALITVYLIWTGSPCGYSDHTASICLRRDKSDCLGWVTAEFVEFPHKGTDEYTFILVQSACKHPNQIEFLLYQIRQSIMYSSSNQYYLLGHRYFWSPKLR